MLITTLPSPHKLDLVERMYSHPAVSGARYNVGARTVYSPINALNIVNCIATKHHKKLWVDLKGRQLRITKWADPSYGEIELNNEIEVDLPAKIFFRGNHWSNIVAYKGNQIVIDPEPKYALGAGQAVNIHGENLKVKGSYLTEIDREYIKAARQLGIHDYMLSFVEEERDMEEVLALDPFARMILKIESPKGLEYVANHYNKKYRLMAARDDLMLNIGDNKTQILPALEMLVQKDPSAIAASHLFTSLDSQGYLGLTDISDLRLLQLMGYKEFMLSDGVSHRHFDEAVKHWQDFHKIYSQIRVNTGLKGDQGGS